MYALFASLHIFSSISLPALSVRLLVPEIKSPSLVIFTRIRSSAFLEILVEANPIPSASKERVNSISSVSLSLPIGTAW